MFIDLVTIHVQAGRGGDGLISFRREKHVSRGGPDGGHGGHGGKVIFRASANEYDLAKFRLAKLIRATDGENGGKNRRSGRSGDDVIVDLPCGTLIKEAESGQLLADLTEPGQSFVAACGGEGGFGNARFKSSLRRAPLLAEKGLAGENRRLVCELKLLAEAGLVGLPNAGKSTFLRAVTRARPKVGAYPFTTLEPHLGISAGGLRLADIPGLIAGAAEGKGLGHQFLRHIERTLVLLHLLDCQSAEPETDYRQVVAELKAYNPGLLDRPRLLVLTKIDQVAEEDIEELAGRLRRSLGRGVQIHAVSAFSGANLPALLSELDRQVATARERRLREDKKIATSETIVFRLSPQEADFRVDKIAGGQFLVTGARIERLALKTDFSNYHARQRLTGVLEKVGVLKQLQSLGWQNEAIVFGPEGTGPLYLDETDSQPAAASRLGGRSRQ